MENTSNKPKKQTTTKTNMTKHEKQFEKQKKTNNAIKNKHKQRMTNETNKKQIKTNTMTTQP